MAGHQGIPHGMPMSHANQIPASGGTTGMSQIPGPQMSQPQKMMPTPQVQQQLQQQQQQQQQQAHHPDNSSIEKMKALVPHLKKSLANLMRLAGESLRRDDIYASSSSSSASSASVEKALEEFFAICDQLEMQLGIALEGYNQVIQHKKYLNPEHLKYSFSPGQNADMVQQYHAYSTVIRSQVALATSLHDALLNCADQISALPSAPSSSTSTASSVATATQQHRPPPIGQPQPGTVFVPGGIAGNVSTTPSAAATPAS